MKVHGRRIATGLVSPRRRVLGVVGETVWIAPCSSNPEPRIVAFDATTLEPRGEIAPAHPIETTPSVEGDLLAHSTFIGRVEVVDLARRETFDLQLGNRVPFHGFAAGLLVLSCDGAEVDAPEIRLADPRTGKVVQVARVAKLGSKGPASVFVSATGVIAVFGGGVAGIRVGSKTRRAAFEEVIDGYPSVAITRDGDRVVVCGRRAIACVDVASCGVVWRAQLPPDAAGDGISCVRVRDDHADVIAYVTRATGPALLLTAIAMDTGAVSPVVERAGTLDQIPERAYAREAAVPRADLVRGAIEIHRVRGQPAVRIPLPDDAAQHAMLVGDRVFVLGKHLVTIDLSPIGAADLDLDLELATVATSVPSDEPAEVTFVGQSSVVIVQHPTYGRTRITRDHEPLAAGDRVVLEDITILPGNVVRVGGWHRAGATKSDERAAPIQLAAATLSPRAPDPDHGRDPLYDAPAPPARPARPSPPIGPLVPLIERLFDDDLPLLRKLAAACDANPAVRGWWNEVGCTFSLDFEPPDDDEISTRLERLRFAPFTSRDGLFHYGVVQAPTGKSRGVAALSPEGDHDFWWDADSFDDWLARRLDESAGSKPSIVTLLLDALELDATFPHERPTQPPAWFGP